MVKKVAILFILCIFLCVNILTVFSENIFEKLAEEAVEIENYALNKEVTSVLYNANGGLVNGYAKEPYFAVDNDRTTAFESWSTVRTGFVTVNLEEGMTFDSINVYPLSSSQTSFIETYALEYSNDGSIWDTIVETTNTNGTAIRQTFPPITAQYVRINILSCIPNGTVERGQYYGFKISELEIFDSKAAINKQKEIARKLSERLEEAVVLIVGYPEAISNNELTFIDPFDKEVVPVLEDDKVYVPVRFVAEEFGGIVVWDPKDIVFMELDGKRIEIDVQSQKMCIHGNKQAVIVKKRNDRVFVPLRQISESLGLEVLWDDSGLIVLSKIKDIFKSDEAELINSLVSILSPSNEILARQIPILDDFEIDSSSQYRRNHKMENFNITDGMFVPNKLARGDDFSWERIDRTFTPGQAVSVQLKMPNINYQSAGILIEDIPIKVNRSYTFFTLTDGIGAEYLLDGEQTESMCTLILTRGTDENSDAIKWYVDGSLKGSGEYIHEGLPYNARIGLYVKHGWQENCNVVMMDNFRLGDYERPFRKMALSAYSPFYYPHNPTPERNEMWAKAEEQLYIKDLNGPLTEDDIQSFKNVVSEAPYPFDNANDDLLFGKSFNLIDSVINLYKITGDLFFLNKLVEYMDILVSTRNDLREDGILLQTGLKEPIWPGFNRAYSKGEAIWVCDFYGAINFLADVGRLIVQNNTLWNVNVPVEDKYGYGPTYLDRAKAYLESADYSVYNYRIKYYYDAKTNEMRYPIGEEWKPVFAESWQGEIGPWNREWIGLSTMNSLIDAYEILNMKPERRALYTGIIKTNIDYFFSTVEIVEKDNMNVAQWWYQKGSGVREDISHGAYDLYFLMKFYESGRYGITRSMMVPFANMILRFDTTSGKFYNFVDDSGGLVTTLHGLYLEYAKIDSRVYDHLKDYMYGTKDIRKVGYLLYGKYIVHGSE